MHYAIIKVSELNALSGEDIFKLLSLIKETGTDTIRKSNNGTQAIIKWEGDVNPCDAVNISRIVYTYDELRETLQEPEWRNERSV
jgi:hypothetical protein